MHIDTPEEARAELDALLAPCFTNPPTAGAIVAINSEKGTQFFSVNMSAAELVTTMIAGGAFLGAQMGLHDEERTLQ